MAFVRGGVVEPGSRPTAAPSASLRVHSTYVPSFLPPSMLAARARTEEKPASVFELPGRADRSRPRAIDAVRDEMQRCVLPDPQPPAAERGCAQGASRA